MKDQIKGSVSLLIGTLIWGTAFIAQSVGMEHIGPFTFQAIRCALAVVLLFPLTFLFEKDKRQFLAKWKAPKLWLSGLICGAALFVASGLQQMGLVYTSAGKAGFITAMYIVLVPIGGLFLGRKPRLSAWLSVALAVTGLYLLSCFGVTEINMGDIYLLGCAFGFTVQITLIDRLSGGLDSLRLNCVQALVCSVLSASVMLAAETIDTASILACWLPLGYAGFLSMGIAYSLQIIGQRHIEPTTAALIMSLESVFAALFGWLLLHEEMKPWELAGCALVFAAVVLSQLPAKDGLILK